jgi:hypothetical protein
MSRTLRAAATALAVLAAAPVALAHEGNPSFRSEVRSLDAEGVTARVTNYDDSLELRNRGGAAVTVLGYRGEPYIRLEPDGTVSVNRRSPAAYLNEDRFAEGVDPPESADPTARPRWEVVARNGVYAWHDHRIHWMSRSLPPQVKDESERTKVFDWTVPIEVDGRRTAIAGTLTWVGEPSEGFPVAAAVSLGAAALAGVALVVVVRRRRRPAREAW